MFNFSNIIGVEIKNKLNCSWMVWRSSYLNLSLTWQFVELEYEPILLGDSFSLLYRVFFLTGTPPKNSKYKKVNLGKVRCI